MTKSGKALLSVLVVSLATLLSGCGWIDADLGDCGHAYSIDYELRLVTNVTTELQTDLNLVSDLHVQEELGNYLDGIFTDFAHDVDLSFYDVVGDSVRLSHERHIMDASESSYTLYLPVHDYMHTAVANLLDTPGVTLENDERCHPAILHQQAADTLDSHATGLFTARLPMEILHGVDQTFDVKLYMANCAASLVADTLGSGIKDLQVYMSGFATDFSICDSLYHFRGSPVFRTEKLALEEGSKECFVSVNFPSRDPYGTKTTIETTDPFIAPYSYEALWKVDILATLPSGTIVRTELGIHRPLRAGQFEILRVGVRPDGAADPLYETSTGVSVAIDWNYGHVQEIPL